MAKCIGPTDSDPVRCVQPKQQSEFFLQTANLENCAVWTNRAT